MSNPEDVATARTRFRDDIGRAVFRARIPILTIAAVYAASLLAGMIMVHAGNTFALGYRDKLVGTAVREDAASIAGLRGENLKAAIYDFGGLPSRDGSAVSSRFGAITPAG